MYNILLSLYQEGKAGEEHLENAVAKGWINKIEKMKIISTN